MTGTLIISGGRIADGSGGALQDADIAVRDGRIVAIGQNLKGDEVLDARGAIVAPGFIDMHTHYDAQLFWDPECTSSSWHGVTSVIIGNCGFALAPCRVENREKLVQMLVELEDMPALVLNAGIEWSFKSFAEYLDRIEALKPSVNVAAYVGHSPVRIDVMGAEAYDRAATDEEIARMAQIVADAMKAGAVGFATSSAPTGRRSATGMADERELIALGQAMGAGGRGVMAMVPGGKAISHTRMYEMQSEIGRPITWTALMATPNGRHRELAKLHKAHYEKGVQVYPQVSGRPLVAATTLRTAFALRPPAMLALEGKGDAERLQAYRDPAFRAKVSAQMADVSVPNNWAHWIVSESASHPHAVGQTMEAFAESQKVDPFDALFDMVVADNLATRFTVIQVNYDEPEVADLLNLDGAVMGLADSGAHPDQICDAVLPTDLLSKWVREKQVIPVEKAVRKLTGELADLFGLDRGYLRVGAPADITVFDPETVAPGPLRRVYDQPAGGERLVADQPEGMRHILVNGAVVRRDGKQVSRRGSGGPGDILRGR